MSWRTFDRPRLQNLSRKDLPLSSPPLSVSVDADCGNAPRKAQVRDWLIALAEADLDTVCSELDDDVRWDVAGNGTYVGIDEVRSHVRDEHDGITRLHLRHLLSHGKQVCAEGATDNQRFALVVTYSGHGKTAKIAEIVSYLAPV